MDGAEQGNYQSHQLQQLQLVLAKCHYPVYGKIYIATTYALSNIMRLSSYIKGLSSIQSMRQYAQLSTFPLRRILRGSFCSLRCTTSPCNTKMTTTCCRYCYTTPAYIWAVSIIIDEDMLNDASIIRLVLLLCRWHENGVLRAQHNITISLVDCCSHSSRQNSKRLPTTYRS